MAQPRTSAPELAQLAASKQIGFSNRAVERLVDGARTGVRVSANNGDSLALLPDVDFGNGTIEVDLRGKDVRGQSFLGVAFHAVDAKTFDCVYFRPFNFKAEDPTNRFHAVQYHSLPEFDWEKLRNTYPGKYEQPVNPAPDPNGWFHARIVITDALVSVYVENASTPSLVVQPLSGGRIGRAGLWVGNGSGGDFANLKFTSQ